ncbi:hypothetical protein HFD88_006880 [Aspergillus terreus]|nr:hypothetical protein HFD88_006880 [Aspergillus terreus]
MVGQQRPASGLPTRRTGLRQPVKRTGTAATNREASPALSTRPSTTSASRLQRPTPEQSATKRKEPPQPERKSSDDTNIHVVVRCRGRNDREVKENSGVVIETEGVKGKTVEVSMGPNAVSNKTYCFDKVFSPAADQATVFEDVALPIVNEMLEGYNCTIFAYGQTGTGKTYTMSGDMTDTLGILSDNAGIIPRVLYALFHKLEDTDSTVKCSFIELYNEELRDLLAVEDNTKLKIFENERKGAIGSTLVQGMEETYIDSATSGIKLLQIGSHKRQVAATKCNDLSSRSHTIFTITVLTKRITEAGDQYVQTGKLNLVDLAGSENIQRSGAENKRAAEAGLINKSLLTLGRVINALVDKSGHIPYRESKLTRLLQNSLGGETKTCIIATVSPARSNLEETISTLDYAFRAKNIRNKPQISTVTKDRMLREFAREIQELKSDLIATRHRNGVYMADDTYEKMIMENDSRRIVNEEQRAKIESMESSLRHKVQELFTLTSNFNDLKQNNEKTLRKLSQTNDVLEQTEIVLKDTQEQLEEEAMVRKAHQNTEKRLYEIGTGLISTLGNTVHDVDGLHAKLERKQRLETDNQVTWQTSTTEVCDVTEQIDARMQSFQNEHAKVLSEMSDKIRNFVESEMGTLEEARSQVRSFGSSFDRVEAEAKQQTSGAHDEMNNVLEEIKVLREDIKLKVGEGLNGLSAAAARISKEVIGEFADFYTQLHTSYSTLGRDFKSMFENMSKHIEGQKLEIDHLRRQLQEANRETVEANRRASSNLAQVLEDEDAAARAEREAVMAQIHKLLEGSNQRQINRLKTKCDAVRNDLSSSGDCLEQATVHHDRQIDEWIFREEQFAKDVTASKDEIKTKLQKDWEAFDQRNVTIQRATESVHQETVRIVDAQMKDVSQQLTALDDFVAKARSHNGRFHEAHLGSLNTMSENVKGSYSAFDEKLGGFGEHIDQLREDAAMHTDSLEQTTAPLHKDIRQPLLDLRSAIRNRPMKEYIPTGVTPQKRRYEYPSSLPRTEAHDGLRSRHRTSKQFRALPFSEDPSPLPSSPLASPPKQFVYSDATEAGAQASPSANARVSNAGLKEAEGNAAKSTEKEVEASPRIPSPREATAKEEPEQPPLKRRRSTSTNIENKAETKLPQKRAARRMAEGRENVPPTEIAGGQRFRNRTSN